MKIVKSCMIACELESKTSNAGFVVSVLVCLYSLGKAKEWTQKERGDR